MGWIGGVRGGLAVLCGVVGLAAVGCGGGEADSAESAAPAAKGSPQQAATRVAELLASAKRRGDKACRELESVTERSIARFGCPPPKSLRRSMASFEVTGVAVHGSGAVVDYRSGEAKDGASILMFVDSSRRWSLSKFGLFYERTVGTSDDDSREAFDTAVDGYLTAVRNGNCRRYADFANTASSNKQAVCDQEFAATAPLARLLRRNRDTTPAYLGGNKRFGFHALELSQPEPRYFTISTITTPAGSIVLDVAPGHKGSPRG